MTDEPKINWDAPLVGKIEVGKTYVDRRGKKYIPTGICFGAWCWTGAFNTSRPTEMDLIAEYVPPKPLKMWMNAFDGGHSAFLFDDQQRSIAACAAYDRIAFPVTITEGHEQ